MALTSGSRLGPYEILSALGAGGMGEVYRARDTKLNRDVAIKVMPDVLAADSDRVARFRREAQVLAALNHPHIAAIYGFEEANDSPALILELVEGPTLADIIAGAGLPASGSRPAAMPEAQGPTPRALALPLSDALNIARQIAEALEAAHEKGIIHRDLKPANVKLTADGKVKVLDFGLAKLVESGGAGSAGGAGGAGAAGGLAGLSMSPTLSVHGTYAGVILGTASYMSPEQARGRPVDTRTDLWAFGCVLYEMLTGRKTFDSGDTVSDAVAAVLRADVDWSALPPDTPDSVRRLLRRCLEKDGTRRLNSAAAARIEIEDARLEPAPAVGTAVPAAAPIVSRTRERVAWGVAVVLALMAAGATAAWLRGGAPPAVIPPETRLEITTPPTNDAISFAISPDAKRIVFAATSNGQTQLWLRSMDAASAQPLPGTEEASYPFWSPDSKSVGFFAAGKLKRLDIGSGLPQTLTIAGYARGGAWGSDNVILFSSSPNGPLSRVPASGGEATVATKIVNGQVGHRFPQFLPDGRKFLFYSRGTEASAGIYLGSLGSLETKRLIDADATGTYVAPGWLLFVRQGTLVARRFDLARGQLSGDSVAIADQVVVDPNVYAAALSASATGVVIYRAGGAAATQLTWFDRSGKPVGTLGAPDVNGLLHPQISPDGRRVAVYRTVQGNTDVWLLDSTRTTRFTFDPAIDLYPLWSPDGNRIVFSENRKGHNDLYIKTSSGAGAEELLLESEDNKAAMSWSPDGRYVLTTVTTSSGRDLWVLPMEGDRKLFPFVNTGFEERLGQFSPDGRWIAYQSDESGHYEINVRPFSAPAAVAASARRASGQWQVSTGGGIAPRWRADGKELYYIAPDGKLMAAPIVTKNEAIEPGVPLALFQTRIAYGGTSPVGLGPQYDVARDGRFLINSNVGDAAAAPITVIQNWRPKN